MKKNIDADMYKGLASYILPEGILEYFEVVDFDEEPVGDGQLYRHILNLYLDERDNRPADM